MSEATTQAPPQANGASAHYEARRLVKLERLKEAVGGLTTERDTAKAEVARLAKENDELKRKTDSSALHKQNQELQSRLRTIEHRKTFDKLATEKGANPQALDLLYEKSGWKAESDEFDEAEMGAVIDQAKPTLPFLFAGKPDPNAPPPQKPAPGSGTGKPLTKTVHDDVLVLKEGDGRIDDASWQMKNYKALTEAAQERVRRGEI